MANATKYKVIYPFEVLSTLFIEDDEIYFTESIYRMNGTFDYSRKVFSSDKTYLGEIRSKRF